MGFLSRLLDRLLISAGDEMREFSRADDKRPPRVQLLTWTGQRDGDKDGHARARELRG